MAGRAQAAGPEAPAELGGLLGLVRSVTGLDIRSAEELRAVSLAALIWLGELLVSVGVALAGGRREGGRRP